MSCSLLAEYICVDSVTLDNMVAEGKTIQSGIVEFFGFVILNYIFVLVCLHKVIYIAVFSDLFSCGIRFECQLFGIDSYYILCFKIILYCYFILVKIMQLYICFHIFFVRYCW